MRVFATGVCIATTYVDGPDGRRHDAVTVNSLTSVSLDPPLISLSLRRDSEFLADLLDTTVWGLSILDAGADDIARVFAQSRGSRAAAVRALWAQAGERTGALLLDSPAWLECRLHQHLEVGDHTIVIGEVLAAGCQLRRPPLIFLQGRYHMLEDTQVRETSSACVSDPCATAEDRRPSGRRQPPQARPGAAGDHGVTPDGSDTSAIPTYGRHQP
jgi:flavin reductase (DIM6/NTAB) family NADH-FMN oxidoreductase RutF